MILRNRRELRGLTRMASGGYRNDPVMLRATCVVLTCRLNGIGEYDIWHSRMRIGNGDGLGVDHAVLCTGSTELEAWEAAEIGTARKVLAGEWFPQSVTE